MIVCHCNSKSSSIWKTNLSTYINVMILKKNHLNYLTKVNRGIWIISCYCALSSTCYMVSFILNYWCAICNIRLEKYNNLISGNTIFITETTQLFLVLIYAVVAGFLTISWNTQSVHEDQDYQLYSSCRSFLALWY